VCAIYEHDRTAEVWERLWASLNNSARSVIAQVPEELACVLEKELALDGAITTGKVITALKTLGFKKVYDAKAAVEASNSELNGEIQKRINEGGKLPLISGNAEGIYRFVKGFYPDLTDYLATGRSPRRVFEELIKKEYADSEKADISSVTAISFTPGISGKYGSGGKTDFTLDAAELARMIRLAGLNIAGLQESSFDAIKIDTANSGNIAKKEIVRGFTQARKALEAVRNGDCASHECASQWIEIEI